MGGRAAGVDDWVGVVVGKIRNSTRWTPTVCGEVSREDPLVQIREASTNSLLGEEGSQFDAMGVWGTLISIQLLKWAPTVCGVGGVTCLLNGGGRAGRVTSKTLMMR